MSQPPAMKRGAEGLKATADLAKQIITLGSALITATVTFADKFRDTATSIPLAPPPTLMWAWGAYLFSAGFAVWTLMAVTGSLNELDRTGTETNGTRANSGIPGALMLVSFLVGLLFTAVAGYGAIR